MSTKKKHYNSSKSFDYLDQILQTIAINYRRKCTGVQLTDGNKKKYKFFLKLHTYYKQCKVPGQDICERVISLVYHKHKNEWSNFAEYVYDIYGKKESAVPLPRFHLFSANTFNTRNNSAQTQKPTPKSPPVKSYNKHTFTAINKNRNLTTLTNQTSNLYLIPKMNTTINTSTTNTHAFFSYNKIDKYQSKHTPYTPARNKIQPPPLMHVHINNKHRKHTKKSDRNRGVKRKRDNENDDTSINRKVYSQSNGQTQLLKRINSSFDAYPKSKNTITASKPKKTLNTISSNNPNSIDTNSAYSDTDSTDFAFKSPYLQNHPLESPSVSSTAGSDFGYFETKPYKIEMILKQCNNINASQLRQLSDDTIDKLYRTLTQRNINGNIINCPKDANNERDVLIEVIKSLEYSKDNIVNILNSTGAIDVVRSKGYEDELNSCLGERSIKRLKLDDGSSFSIYK